MSTIDDRDTFAEMIYQSQTAVYNVAYRILGNVQDAEDAAQETFLRAYRFRHTYKDGYQSGPWLKRITVNVCLQRLEKAYPTQSLDEDWLQPPDPHPGPQEQTEACDLQARIQAELLRLPPRYRAVIELRHYQDLSYQEIAAVLNRPLSDVRSDLFRARRMLAQNMKDLR
ncbi:MAG: sigma-70 family RNA polymerase sigma factor [Anaerolineae bacterium]|nr:sigma-70 family RNA polymerase sigma factor [Anaerolineae bacterium]